LEEDARESRERRDRQDDRIARNSERIARLETELALALRGVQDDLGDIKAKQQLQAEGGTAQRVAYITASGAVIAAMLIAISAVVGKF
jgi:hypothetical protein